MCVPTWMQKMTGLLPTSSPDLGQVVQVLQHGAGLQANAMVDAVPCDVTLLTLLSLLRTAPHTLCCVFPCSKSGEIRPSAEGFRRAANRNADTRWCSDSPTSPQFGRYWNVFWPRRRLQPSGRGPAQELKNLNFFPEEFGLAGKRLLPGTHKSSLAGTGSDWGSNWVTKSKLKLCKKSFFDEKFELDSPFCLS